MCVNRFAKLLIPLFLALAPIPGFGHEYAGAAMPAAAPPFNETGNAATQQEIKEFAHARIAARRAIAIAERRGAGAKVVDLSFDGTSSRLAYRVKVLLNDELWETTIDASTGVAVDGGPNMPVSSLSDESKAALAAFSAAGIGLSEAVAIAEQYGSGKAVGAGLQHDGAKLVLLVVIVSDGSLKEISVAPDEARRLLKASVRARK